jgi:multidrug efflux system membrane fusion protein
MSAASPSQRHSVLIASGVVVVFVVWLMTGLIGGDPAAEDSAADTALSTMTVSVRHSQARTTQRTIVASARTEPDRAIELKAETAGAVVAINVERGASVAEGQLLVQLELGDREATLAEIEALIVQRELEHQAAERLRGQQFISEAELAAKYAALVSSTAARDRIRLDIDHTRIRAPFDAVVYDRLVEIGDYVGVGDPIAQLVDADPLIVVANVNERSVGSLSVGSSGVARVLGGAEIAGEVRYLAPVADEATRSFRVELAIPNPDLALRVGTSAELVIGVESIVAHEVSSGLLTLADDGTVGIKLVDAGNRVRFVAVEIVESTPSGGVLITGLPEEARIITVGQGFVADGQLVNAVEETSELTQAGNERTY